MEEREHWRVEGAVVRGERTATHATDDQRLLESRGATGWVHTDPWRVLRIQSEFIDGFGTLAELGPAVSPTKSPSSRLCCSTLSTGEGWWNGCEAPHSVGKRSRPLISTPSRSPMMPM